MSGAARHKTYARVHLWSRLMSTVCCSEATFLGWLGAKCWPNNKWTDRLWKLRKSRFSSGPCVAPPLMHSPSSSAAWQPRWQREQSSVSVCVGGSRNPFTCTMWICHLRVPCAPVRVCAASEEFSRKTASIRHVAPKTINAPGVLRWEENSLWVPLLHLTET